MQRSDTYYTVRSIVRLAFWAVTVLASIAAFIAATWVLWAVIG